MKILTLSLLCFLAYFDLAAQKENNTWYFGNHSGLDFNSGSPVALTDGLVNTLEGTASISDKNTGTVLFYTDGVSVWNVNDSVMPNGTGLFGHVSSSQSALIVPDPGNANQFYVFTVGAQAGKIGSFGGMAWSKVDMTLDNGLGDVISKNDVLLYSTTEKLCVTRHCNGKDYWVIAHGWDTDSFYVFQVTPSGILPPVISSIGSVHKDLGSGSNTEAIGCMKISPDGEKLALACFYPMNVFEMFDFDNSSGVISGSISKSYPVPISNSGPYGVSFSPNSSKVYVTWSSVAGTANYIFQYDLNAGNPTAIIASEVVVGSNSNKIFGALQLAPDGKIYVMKCNTPGLPGNQNINAIDSPDVAGISCAYNGSPINVGGFCNFGLPNFNDCSLSIPTLDLGPDSTISITTIFNLNAPFGSQSYLWSTGQTDSTISVTVSSDTTIWAAVVNTNGCSQTDTLHIYSIIGASVDDPENSRIKIYPNPFHTSFNIRPAIGDAIYSITITDLTGRKVFYSNTKSTAATIDLASQPAGIYFLDLQMVSGKVYRKKVVRE